MSAHILAAASYGAQRVIDPSSGKPVSAYKLGYTTAVSAVLLALYGGQAREVSPRGASYRYLQLDGTVLLRHGHLLLSVTAAELAQAEAIARHSHRAGVFVWRDGQWWALPDAPCRTDRARRGRGRSQRSAAPGEEDHPPPEAHHHAHAAGGRWHHRRDGGRCRAAGLHQRQPPRAGALPERALPADVPLRPERDRALAGRHPPERPARCRRK